MTTEMDFNPKTKNADFKFWDNGDEEEKKPDLKSIRQAKKQTVIKKSNQRDMDIWEVKQLDSTIEPVLRPSEAIDRLNESRRQRHELLMSKIADDLNNVNLRTEKNIKMSSGEVKAHMEDYKTKLNEMLENINESELGSYHGSVFRDIQGKANKYKTEQQSLINDFYEDLLRYEGDRSKDIEEIFRGSFEEVRKIAYILPYELQLMVEHESLKINQLTLNNRRCYEDLRLKLTLITEQTFKSFTDEVFRMQEIWVRHKVSDVKEQLIEEAESRSEIIIPDACTRLELKGQELILGCTPNGFYSTCEAETWFENVSAVIGTLEEYGHKLIGLYKRVLDAVFLHFNNQVEGIKQELNTVEVLDIQERILQPIVFEIQTSQHRDINVLESYWQDMLCEIRSFVKELVDFLLDAGRLWDGHKKRISESKILILAVLEKTEENNRKGLQELEIKLNMALDVTRQEYTKSKLEKSFESVTDILKTLESRLKANYSAEVAVIEDFYKMVDLEADVLSSELKEFIYTLHKPKVIERHMNRVSLSQFLTDDKLIHKQILACTVQIESVKAWKQGVWSALENFARTTRESLKPSAIAWVDLKVKELTEKMEAQLDIHYRRCSRTQIEVVDVRMREIDDHQMAFDCHKAGVKQVYDQMKADLVVLVNQEQEKINGIEENLLVKQTKAKTEIRANVVKFIQIQAEREKNEFEKRVTSAFTAFEGECESQVQTVQQTSVNFMKAIRLFSENGNYNAEEAKNFVNNLEVIIKESNNELKNITKAAAKEESDVIKKGFAIYDPIIQTLTWTYEELKFSWEVNENVNKCLWEVQELASDVLANFETLKKHSEQFLSFFENQCCPLNEESDLTWLPLLSILYKNVSNLFYPLKLSVRESTMAEDTAPEECTISARSGNTSSYASGLTDVSAKATISSPIGGVKVKEKPPLTCHDYRPQLLKTDTPPECDCTFMTEICSRLWDGLDVLQRLACNFYSRLNERRIIRKELIPPTYESFANELLVKFESFEMQCEQLWLRTILDILPIIGHMKVAANSYIERRIWEYSDEVVGELDCQLGLFVNKMKKKQDHAVEELHKLENKLAPLYGHPKNQQMLQELEEEVIHVTARLEVDWEESASSYQLQLDRAKDAQKYDPTYENLKNSIFSQLRCSLFLPELGETMLLQILQWIENGGYILREEEEPKPLSNSTLSIYGLHPEDEIASSTSQDLGLNFGEDKPQSIACYLSILKKIIEGELRDAGMCSETDTDRSYPLYEASSFHTAESERPLCFHLNLLVEPIEYDKHIANSVKDISAKFIEIPRQANSIVKNRGDTVFQWLDLWKVNVSKVKKLYTVKYPNPPPEIKKIKNHKMNTSVTSTLPRLCPKKKLDYQEPIINNQKQKIRSVANKSFSCEKKKLSSVRENLQINLHKLNSSDTHPEQTRYASSSSLGSISPNKRSQIPVPSKLNSHRSSSPSSARSPPPEKKISSLDAKSKTQVRNTPSDCTENSLASQSKKQSDASGKFRFPSPTDKPLTGNRSYKEMAMKERSWSPEMQPRKSSEPRIQRNFSSDKQFIRTEMSNECSPRTPSNCGQYATPRSRSRSPVKSLLQVTSAQSGTRTNIRNEKPLFGRSDHDLICKIRRSPSEMNNSTPVRELIREFGDKSGLDIESSNRTQSTGEIKERKSTFNEKKSKRTLSLQDNSALVSTFRKSSSGVIRTISGHELLLTPSMEFEIDQSDENEDIVFAQLLRETEDKFENKNLSEVRVFQDDANEYDSEATTDGEANSISFCKNTQSDTESGNLASTQPKRHNSHQDVGLKTNSAVWRSREEELSGDVSYRQSLYHPAVMRQSREETEDVRPKSKIIENQFELVLTQEKLNHSRSTSKSHFKRVRSPQTWHQNRENGCVLKSWTENAGKLDLENRRTYNEVSLVKDHPRFSKGHKRERTRVERITGALLRLTTKIIRLLAIFNLWPGDNCQLLTAHSLQSTR